MGSDLRAQAEQLACGHDWMVEPIESALRGVRDAERQLIDVEAMRANLHATFGGGHKTAETIEAFHHGIDTVCNVLAAHQKGEQTNGILPAASSPRPSGEGEGGRP